MAKRGENIYKREDGRWEGRCIDKKTHKYKYLYGDSYKDVKEKIRLYKPVKNDKDLALLFCNVCDEWLNLRKPVVRESTYVKYYNSLKNHLKPYFGSYNVNEIAVDDINNFVFAKMQNGNLVSKKGLSVQTISGMIRILDSIFEFAVARKYMDKYVSFGNIKLPKIKDNDIRVLTNSEKQTLMRYLRDGTDNYKMGILLCLYTGMRIGEICALKWSNINLYNKIIYVEKTLQRIQNVDRKSDKKTRIIVTLPKTYSSVREIPISNFLINTLMDFKPEDTDTYFLTGEKERFVEPRSYESMFKRYTVKCEMKNVNFHALRHTFATSCIEVGFEIKSLSEVLGHSNVQMTLNRYVHPTMEVKRNNMNLLTALK